MAIIHPLAAQAALVLDSRVPTFDDVPLVPGVHIRWTFAPELGFPPYGFQIYRKVITPGESQFPPPLNINPQEDPAAAAAAAAKGAPITTSPSSAPTSGPPVWLPPDSRGWRLLSQLITIPLTRGNWPARYPGAPNPGVASPDDVRAADLAEARRRLGGSAPELRVDEVHAALDALVRGFPATKLYDVPGEPTSATGGLTFALPPMRRLLLFALNPHLARVLGLSYVDSDIEPGVDYLYYVEGNWFGAAAASDSVIPGQGLPNALARGWSAMDGAITSSPGATPPTAPGSGAPTSWFWRWLRGTDPLTAPAVPPAPRLALSGLAGSLGAAAPAALLVAQSADAAPRTVCRITFRRPVMVVEVQVAGHGSISVLTDDPSLPVVPVAAFNSSTLTTQTLIAPSAEQPIHAIDISVSNLFLPLALGPLASESMFVIVGAVTAHLLSGDYIGVRGAKVSSRATLARPAAPDQPVAFFRGRRALVDESGPTLTPRSTFELQWPAPTLTPADTAGDPLDSPLDLPPPTRAVGFIAERSDSGADGVRVNRFIFAASQPRTPDTPPGIDQIYRLLDDNAPDPVTSYAYRVAGFDLFGALSDWSNGSNAIGVDHMAVAPTRLRVRRFGNSSDDGGAATLDGSAWQGSTLTLDVAWSGGALVAYPDTHSARVRVTALDTTPETILTPTLDLTVPAPELQAATITGVAFDATQGVALLTTSPAFTPMKSDDPPAMLLTSTPPNREGLPNPDAFVTVVASAPGGVVAIVQASADAPIVAHSSNYIGRPAYLVPGFTTTVTLHPPLVVPVAQRTARAAADALPSRSVPFDPTEQVIDPNNRLPPRSPTPSERVFFTGQQWLTPRQPDPPTDMSAGQIIHHRYYDPADFHGNAGITLTAFTTTAAPGVLGYRLMRTPVETLALADIERMRAHGGLAALRPLPSAVGALSPLLSAWQATLPDWLTSYSAWVTAENARRATIGLTPLTSVNSTNALNDDTARRAFIEHYYGSLLDDELRALGDDAELSHSYARARLEHLAAGDPVTDTVAGKGSGRTLYTLKAINDAGGESRLTPCSGPYYLRPVTPPPAPGWLQAAPLAGQPGLRLVWPSSASPMIAGYLVYRVTNAHQLEDLRYFGPDWAHPLPPDQQPQLTYAPTQQPALTFDRAPDPRILAIAPDPRLFARDYEGSDMAEVTLPVGVAPTDILGVYRLDRFDVTTTLISSQPAAFNYYQRGGSPSSTTAGFTPAGATPARVTGLRVGLGASGVPVVVVAATASGPLALGTLPVVAGVSAPVVTYQDATATAGVAYTYTIVAVDTYGNRSIPSPQALGQAV